MDIFLILLPLILSFFFLGLGYMIGVTVENRHYRSLEKREAVLSYILETNLKNVPTHVPVQLGTYVDGQAVISSDYFKTFASKVRAFFGGEMKSLERIMERARREAIVRMKEAAQAKGATHIYNIRLETSNIGRGMGANKGMIMAEVHAYGTAVRQ